MKYSIGEYKYFGVFDSNLNKDKDIQKTSSDTI
jgi:hypothetical protein